jgi:hypothetical protein
MTIKGGVECERPTEIYGRDLTADHQDIFIRQAHESLVADIHRLPGATLPAERAGQHTILQIQHPLIVQQGAGVQLHVRVPDERSKRQPVGGIG